jgi:hypothetical protein
MAMFFLPPQNCFYMFSISEQQFPYKLRAWKAPNQVITSIEH